MQAGLRGERSECSAAEESAGRFRLHVPGPRVVALLRRPPVVVGRPVPELVDPRIRFEPLVGQDLLQSRVVVEVRSRHEHDRDEGAEGGLPTESVSARPGDTFGEHPVQDVFGNLLESRDTRRKPNFLRRVRIEQVLGEPSRERVLDLGLEGVELLRAYFQHWSLPSGPATCAQVSRRASDDPRQSIALRTVDRLHLDAQPKGLPLDLAPREQLRDAVNGEEYNLVCRERYVGPGNGVGLLRLVQHECDHVLRVDVSDNRFAFEPHERQVCNRLQLHFRVSQCQAVSGEALDRHVAAAFLEALSPVELDAYERALASKRATDREIDRARLQQVERLRYQARLAERQFLKVDPDNRLVAAELERRWEVALRVVKEAEAALDVSAGEPPTDEQVTAELKAAFSAVGQQLPQVWHTAMLSARQKKALLRCLVDKVVVVREPREVLQTRVVWKGGEVSTLAVPVAVASLEDLSGIEALTERILELSREGKGDQEIADLLTREGVRSARQERIGAWAVKRIRLDHGVLIKGLPPHPRRVPGHLTVSRTRRVRIEEPACLMSWTTSTSSASSVATRAPSSGASWPRSARPARARI